jgi:hypothetical protein
VSEHQLDDADVDAVRQEPAGTLVPQVVPVEIDPRERVSIRHVVTWPQPHRRDIVLWPLYAL